MCRPYVAEDLRLLKKLALVALVEAQADKWPKKSFNSSKANKQTICAALLDPANGFTTELPMPTLGHTTTSQDDTPIIPVAQSIDQPRITPEPQAEHPNDMIPITPVLQRMNEGLPLTPVSLGPAPIIHTYQPSSTYLQQTRPVGVPFTTLLFPSTSSNQAHGIVKQMLRVYVRDDRHPSIETQMISRAIEVTEVDREGCKSGEWWVSANEVIEKLQESPAVIIGSGSVRVGIPDELRHEYTSWFIEGDIPFLPQVVAQPEYLKVQENSTLDLRVMVGTPLAPYTKRFKAYQTALNLKSYSSDEDDQPSQPALSSLPVDAKPLEIARQRLDDAEIQWLQDCVASQPGVDQFNENCGRQLQNVDIIFQWSFAVKFLTAYHRKPCGAPGLNNRLITKKKICVALGVSETWLAGAEESHRRVNIFGRNGTHFAANIAMELETVRPNPHGSGWLGKFLSKWEEDNPNPIHL